MARKPLQLDSSEINIATALTANNGKLHKAALLKLNSNGTVDETNMGLGIFQINPSTWEENKTSNWVGHSIPGQSDPVYQWVSGGPRIVSFDALVTKDTAYFEKQAQNSLGNLATNAINVVGGIASAMAGIDIMATGAALAGFFSSPDPNSKLSIANELNYYRSLLYPEYKESVIQNSPPLLILYAGSTFSSFGYLGNSTIDKSIHVWVLTSLKIQVTKQLPNLSPMEAYVSFQLTQYPVASFSASQFTTGGTQTNQSNSNGFLSTISNFLGF